MPPDPGPHALATHRSQAYHIGQAEIPIRVALQRLDHETRERTRKAPKAFACFVPFVSLVVQVSHGTHVNPATMKRTVEGERLLDSPALHQGEAHWIGQAEPLHRYAAQNLLRLVQLWIGPRNLRKVRKGFRALAWGFAA